MAKRALCLGRLSLLCNIDRWYIWVDMDLFISCSKSQILWNVQRISMKLKTNMVRKSGTSITSWWWIFEPRIRKSFEMFWHHVTLNSFGYSSTKSFDMVLCMMSTTYQIMGLFTEKVIFSLNKAPSKAVENTPYKI